MKKMYRIFIFILSTAQTTGSLVLTLSREKKKDNYAVGKECIFSTVLKGSNEKSLVATLLCSTIDISVW